jgi:hypothetical protein
MDVVRQALATRHSTCDVRHRVLYRTYDVVRAMYVGVKTHDIVRAILYVYTILYVHVRHRVWYVRHRRSRSKHIVYDVVGPKWTFDIVRT